MGNTQTRRPFFAVQSPCEVLMGMSIHIAVRCTSLAVAAALLFGAHAARAAAAESDPACNATKLLGNVDPASAGGVLSLKTNWINAYTSPIRIVAEREGRSADIKEAADKARAAGTAYKAPDDLDRKWWVDGNSSSWALSFGTNTFASRKEPEKMELLFRQTALYNLYTSFVGLRSIRSSAVTAEKLVQGAVYQAAASEAAAVAANQGAAGGHALAKLAASAAVLTAQQMEAQYAVRAAADENARAVIVAAKKTEAETAAAMERAAASKAREAAASAAVNKIKRSVDATTKDPKSDAASVVAQLKKDMEDEAGWNSIAAIDCKNPIVNHRLLAADRYYWGRDITANSARTFISNGIGIRGLAGEADKVSTTGLGTIYVGYGMDGPLYSLGSLVTDGYASAEIFASYNWVNRAAIGKLLDTDVRRRTFHAVGLNLEIGLIDKLSLKLAYSRGFGALGREIGELVMTSVSLKTN